MVIGGRYMKRKFIYLILTITLSVGLLILTGCSSTTNAKTEKRFKEVSDEGTFDIVYDSKTKVIYAVSDSYYNYGTVTLLVNTEGKPLLYGD